MPRFRAYASGTLAFGDGTVVKGTIYPTGFYGLAVQADMVSFPGAILEMQKRADPGAGPAGFARLYVEDNGAGKSRLTVRFGASAPQYIMTEP